MCAFTIIKRPFIQSFKHSLSSSIAWHRIIPSNLLFYIHSFIHSFIHQSCRCAAVHLFFKSGDPATATTTMVNGPSHSRPWSSLPNRKKRIIRWRAVTWLPVVPMWLRQPTAVSTRVEDAFNNDNDLRWFLNIISTNIPSTTLRRMFTNNPPWTSPKPCLCRSRKWTILL